MNVLADIFTCKSVERKIIINSSTGIYEIYVANSGSIEKLIKNIIKFNKGKQNERKSKRKIKGIVQGEW